MTSKLLLAILKYLNTIKSNNSWDLIVDCLLYLFEYFTLKEMCLSCYCISLFFCLVTVRNTGLLLRVTLLLQQNLTCDDPRQGFSLCSLQARNHSNVSCSLWVPREQCAKLYILSIAQQQPQIFNAHPFDVRSFN